MHFGDAEFASWLHEKGFTHGNRSYKLFSFSNLITERYKVFKDRFNILADSVTLYLTFHIDEAVQHFIHGLFQRQQFGIGDKRSRADFEVRNIEMLPEPEFKDTMSFQALSPVCVSMPVEKNGKLQAFYLSPGHNDFNHRFFENLVLRYKAVHPGYELSEDRLSACLIKPTSKPKSRLIKIKADTPQETRVRGYLFDFECKAPAELLKFGYEAGFGEKGSLGFGCVGVIEN